MNALSVTALPPVPAARDRPLAVYVHFPFCLSRCGYCDFATTAPASIPRRDWRRAVIAELERRTAALAGWPVDSVYFGGGTPSLWGPGEVEAVLAAVRKRLGMLEGAEVSLEWNPGSAATTDLAACASVGVTRISVGVQTLDDRALAALGRRHRADEARQTLAALSELVAAGRLASANADLLYGLPGQRVAEAAADVSALLALGLPHLSAYALTLEAATPLAGAIADGREIPPDEAVAAAVFSALPEWLAQAGLQRYEVSNHARPGHECRHNLAIWSGSFYIGLGAGAHGFLPDPEGGAGVRYANLGDPAAWLTAVARGEPGEALRERVSGRAHLDERVLTGLRLAEGLDLGLLAADLGPEPVARLRLRAAAAIAEGLPLVIGSDRLRVRRSGFRWLDAVILELLTAGT
jgi:oxygen-independent coproporphyrinogen-3 oxidase